MSISHHTDRELSILLLEEEASHVELIRQAFERWEALAAVQGPADPEAAAGGCGELPRAVHIADVASLEEARRALEKASPDLLIANLQLADGSGIELLETAGETPYPVLILADQPGEQHAVKAIKAGAIDYLIKSEATLSALPQTAAQALREWRLWMEHQHLQDQIAEIPPHKQHRLGRELHDGLGQQITGLGLLARSLAKRLSDAPKREQEMAEQLASGLEQALVEVRSLARGLVPVQMDAHGLVSALKELASRVSKQSGIAVDLRLDRPILIADNETATHVYRVVQEAINNAIKHAEASKIVMILEADEDQAIIEVRDDGKGLPEDSHNRPGLGFRTMFHRCRLFGGSLDIFTHHKGGTRMRCCFPLHPDKVID
jgi:signal transduction histidine kinase